MRVSPRNKFFTFGREKIRPYEKICGGIERVFRVQLASSLTRMREAAPRPKPKSGCKTRLGTVEQLEFSWDAAPKEIRGMLRIAVDPETEFQQNQPFWLPWPRICEILGPAHRCGER